MNIKEEVKEKPIEMISGIVMVLLGIGLAAAGGSGAWQVAGGALAAFGGALLSWSTASVKTLEQARKILRNDLESAGRHLGDAAGKISRAVQAVNTGALDPGTAIDRISQTTSTLYGLVNDVQMLAGSQFSSDHLLGTVNSCEEMARNLETKLSLLSTIPPKEDDASFGLIRDEVESLRMQLESARREIENPERQVIAESVECPECGFTAKHPLGTLPGDSAAPHCSACGARFHAHRGPNGSVFTKKWGSSHTFTMKHLDVACPTCKKTIPVRVPRGGEIQTRYCLNCYTRMDITSDGDVRNVQQTPPLRSSRTFDHEGRIILTCPECDAGSGSLFIDTAHAFAVCQLCKKLLIHDIDRKTSTSDAQHNSTDT